MLNVVIGEGSNLSKGLKSSIDGIELIPSLNVEEGLDALNIKSPYKYNP